MNDQNSFSPQYENRRRIFTSVIRIDSTLTGTFLPAFTVDALSWLASTGVRKLILNGLYLKKRGHVSRIETDEDGLYLGPTSGKWFETVGNGLYLMKQDGLCGGRWLILGPDSGVGIFKNIPILGMILWYSFQKKYIIYTKNGNWWIWW